MESLKTIKVDQTNDKALRSRGRVLHKVGKSSGQTLRGDSLRRMETGGSGGSLNNISNQTEELLLKVLNVGGERKRRKTLEIHRGLKKKTLLKTRGKGKTNNTVESNPKSKTGLYHVISRHKKSRHTFRCPEIVRSNDGILKSETAIILNMDFILDVTTEKHLIVGKCSSNKISVKFHRTKIGLLLPFLLNPSWRTNILLRLLSVFSGMSQKVQPTRSPSRSSLGRSRQYEKVKILMRITR